MQKDIIYIDAEDDITTIIGKIKKSKGTLIALVPPKRVGPIHGAVNLRLIARAASQSKKRVVLVTSDQPLALLASSAGIPTAKNLQSKPELAKLDVLDVDDGSDVIDGSSLPDNRIDTKKTEDDEKAEGQEDDPLAEKPKEVKVERKKQPEKERNKKIENSYLGEIEIKIIEERYKNLIYAIFIFAKFYGIGKFSNYGFGQIIIKP